MSEFPRNPTKRQLERQQAISTVISGMCYSTVNVAMQPEPISGMQDVCLEPSPQRLEELLRDDIV